MLTPEEQSALWLSFKVAGIATLASLAPGIFLGWLIWRLSPACIHGVDP